MADLDLRAITLSRAELSEAVVAERSARADIDQALRAREDAQARGDEQGANEAGKQLAAAQKAHARAATSVDELRDRLTNLSDALLAAVAPEDAVASLIGEIPVLLLPARLETRFAEGGLRLDVRIFPDQVHVTAHDRSATADEVEGLTWYWQHRWPDPDDEGLADEAWQVLSSRIRPSRAAFLVRAYPPKARSDGAGPTFPDITLRAPGDPAPAHAGLLPDRWCVLGFTRSAAGELREVFRVWGANVPDTLSAGPGPALGKPGAPGAMPQDPALAWVHDPDAAERLGMLVKVRQSDCVPGYLLPSGVDRLLAVGVDWTMGPQQAADAVRRHLQAHADEGHLGFVPQGAPTNSTGQQRSAYSTDPALARAQSAPHRTAAPAPGTAAAHLAYALGIGSDDLGHVAGADLREQAWQEALLKALWPATGGYFLTEMLDPLAEDPAINAALRRHVVSFLRAAGPLPTLRVGAQPYGVLPVTARGRYRPAGPTRAEADVRRVSEAMRRMAARLVDRVPRLASVRTRADVDQVTAALLARTPVPWSLTVRQLVGPVQRHAMGKAWSAASSFQRAITAALLSELGATSSPMLTELTHHHVDHALDVPWVLRIEGSGRGTGYLAEVSELLRRDDGRTILDGRQDATTLLEALLACSAVRALDGAAKATARRGLARVPASRELVELLMSPADRMPSTMRVESTPVAAADTAGMVALPRTPAELSQMVLPAVTGNETLVTTVARLLARADPQLVVDVPDDPLAELAELAQGVDTLVDAPADQLEWAFRGTLDLFATRLDAWITSLATARLRADRSHTAAGLHVGGWAAVEDLRPDSGPASESLGFVHTPSLAQAASAAVLRSARLSHADSSGAIFDLDLSSRRVRHALKILEGVSSGQRLAALLGYRFERMLQDRDLTLAAWILPLRLQCPLRSDRPDDATTPPQTPAWSAADQPTAVESVAARDVVDGVALLARWGAEGLGLLAAAGVRASDRDAVGAVLDDLASLADAVSDVLVGEAVHQATSGNLERAGAALAAHDRQGSPPGLEFVRTPRAGHSVAHRVGLWLDAGATEPAPGWPTDLRSAAEPRFDRWVGSVLGDPGAWQVAGRLVHPVPGDPGAVPPVPAGADVVHSLDPVGMDTLGLSALSVLNAATRPGAGHGTELEARVAEALAVQAHGRHIPVLNGDRIELVGDLRTLLQLARWAAEVMASSPLNPADLADSTDLGRPPVRAAAADLDEARKRADIVRGRLADLLSDLDARRKALADRPDDEARVEAVAAAMVAMFGVVGMDALPGLDRAQVVEQARELSTRIAARLADIAKLPVPAATPADAGPLDIPAEDPVVARARTAVRLALGEAQPFLPVLVPAEPARISASQTARTQLLGGDETAVVTWLHRNALVRPELEGLSALLLRAEAGGADVPADLQVLQLPHQAGCSWTALPFAVVDGSAVLPRTGTVALVLHAPFGLSSKEGAAGVLIDAWTETIPLPEETTAVAFHYDAPGARAPQTMLLAVRPEPDLQRWDLDAITGAVHEALELARLRSLGPRELAAFATLLPALFLPDGDSHDSPGLHLVDLLRNLEEAKAGGLVADHVLGKGSWHG